MKQYLLGFTLLTGLLCSLAGFAETPMEAVQSNVNKVLDILRDPELQPDSAMESKKNQLEAVYAQMFDKTELSKRTLGANWAKLNPAQQSEFSDLYLAILKQAYIDKILSYTNEKIVFSKEVMLSPTQAEVQTRVITSTTETPIFYRVITRNGSWKVYDVIAENVSLVQNYRSQFNTILSKSTVEQLLEVLRKKTKN